ncbi:MAG: nuclear transport factor 2 family protein [Actinobacteria bacterium]|nr:nuclear transport factor 2 family protein [Actinomycetota bacterium]
MTDGIRELLDRIEVADLVHRYCRHFDENDPEALGGLFVEDATIDYGPGFPTIHGGPAAIAEILAVGLRDLFAATSHHVSNFEIWFDGPDRASSVCYVYAWHRYVDGRPDGELWGRYRHTYRRTDAGWRIATLRLEEAGSKDFHRVDMHPIGRRPPD